MAGAVSPRLFLFGKLGILNYNKINDHERTEAKIFEVF